MDVYIQSHALIRLKERVNTVDDGVLHLTLSFSCMEKEIAISSSGKPMIVYRILEYKMGYFPVEIIDGVVVIRTFLFITNSGTPEGDKLDEELKIGKFEKQFLQIDKLSTFLYSDLMSDERVRKIFDKAGLGYFANLDPNLFDKKESKMHGYAADFMKYINPVISNPWEQY